MKKIFTLLALTISFIMNAQTDNTSTGTSALNSISTGDNNSAFGVNALTANSSGGANTAIGKEALYSNTTSSSSTAVGNYSLKNSNGFYNTAVGTYSLYGNTSGARNVGIGLNSLFTNTTGSYNTAIGYATYASANNASNQTIIGYQATGQADNSVVLGNDNVTAVYMGEDSGATIYAAGLRTASNAVLTLSGDDASFADDLTIGGDVVVSSDARLKSNIVSLGSTLSRLLLIDGKSYEMKGKQKIGVLAQDIKEVFPELVTEDENEMLAVNYQGLVPVLINALKEQEKRLERLEAIISKMDK
ncbi:tail fiber domain-containing protein [Flavobacteriaceae bacterium]|nr:tail fiber domain-containing protein [Flavobacteriaceae bacterium]